jgi:type I restriction enzyme S subunit
MVRKGYKQTEVGVIPEDWKLVRVGELEPFVTSGSRGWARYYSKFGAPFIRITNLRRESIYLDLSDLRLVDLPEGVSEGKRTQLHNGDLLISITADIGIIGYLDNSVSKPAYINQHISLVRFDSRKSDSKFIAYFLASESVQRLFRGATDQGAKAGLNLDTIRSLKFAFPPTDEQRSIAQALSDVDALIAALDKAIAKQRAIKTATMQQLLTGRKRLPGFGEGKGYQQTEVGTIPEDWNVRALGNLGRFKNGINKGSEDFGHGSPFVNLMDVFGISSISEVKHLGLVNSNDAEKKVYDLKEGDVLFIRSSVKPSGVGLTTIITRDLPSSVYSGFLIRFRDNGKLETDFKKYCFSEEKFRKRVIASSTISANTNINQDNLKQLCLAYPESSAEQRAIATVLSNMDAEIAALETRLTKTQFIKQGMMQALLTGRTRLI